MDELTAGLRAWGPRLDLSALIGRTPHELDPGLVGGLLTGRRVLITGAGGSIGSALARLAAGFEPATLVLMERAENALFEVDRRLREQYPALDVRAALHDVTDAEGTRELTAELRPDVVLHAAAHKHVPLMEDHPHLAVINNVLGTASIADAAAEAGCDRFVLVSTDKAVRPSSVMGATKRLAERYVAWLHGEGRRGGTPDPTTFGMVRFGNVLGSAASVLQVWSAQLASGGPMTITDARMTRYFMTIGEAATLVLQAAAMTPRDAAHAPVFVLDMGRPIEIVALAERFARAHGFEPRLPAGVVSSRPGGLSGRPEVEIVCTGARPGEKLHEALAYAAETLIPTAHPGVRVSRVADAGGGFDGRAALGAIAGLGPRAPRAQVVELLRALVPEFGEQETPALAA